jgi:hypothetical protein
MQMRSLDTTASNRVAGPLQFIILPLSREEMGDGWENTGVNAGDNKPVWIKAYNGVVVFTAEDAAPSMIAQALRERLSPSGRFAADKDLVSHLDKILSGAGIPVPQVYDLSIVVDHADTETPAVTSLEEIIISGKEYADRISAGRTPAQILAEIRERKITAQRQSKEKLYFNDSSKTLEGLLGNMKLLKGSNSGNLIVQPEIFNGLPGEGKQEAINKAGEYMKDLHITLFVDLSGREDQKEVLETEKQQYRDAGFSGYVTGTRTPGNTISIHWFEKPDGEKLVEANAALEESYEDLTALQGALKSALADAGSFVFDLDRIQKTLGKDRDVEMQVALQGLLNDLFKDDPDYLQAQIEKQMKGLDPQKLQRILSAA